MPVSRGWAASDAESRQSHPLHRRSCAGRNPDNPPSPPLSIPANAGIQGLGRQRHRISQKPPPPPSFLHRQEPRQNQRPPPPASSFPPAPVVPAKLAPYPDTGARTQGKGGREGPSPRFPDHPDTNPSRKTRRPRYPHSMTYASNPIHHTDRARPTTPSAERATQNCTKTQSFVTRRRLVRARRPLSVFNPVVSVEGSFVGDSFCRTSTGATRIESNEASRTQGSQQPTFPHRILQLRTYGGSMVESPKLLAGGHNAARHLKGN